ncbi:MFS transporter [Serratia fonticola]|uniref:MFS transporter n=1 Tax=Serratia fonticola TaxID=47917 RepID=A0AAJ1YLN7_SERFO|nr:MFS transporter [Serratia fonticola]MDQ9130385.1 MFS transporter [Serratia fonticola]
MENINGKWLGLPLNLIWGYMAIAIFMTGDGFEMAFLSHYIKELGFTPAQSSLVFTVYGFAAALAAWVSGVLAEVITPQKTMLIGFLMWCIFHVLFLTFGLGQQNYALILLFYGIRGLAYPLFLYSFIVIIVHNVKDSSLSSALGWFWAVYSVGIGVAGSYIPSVTIPYLGELGTLWLALLFCGIGGGIAMFSLRNVSVPKHQGSTKEKFTELSRAVTLFHSNKNILYASMVRIINTLSLFGFPVIMPMMFVDELGFTMAEWLKIWTVFFATTIFFNIFWGIVSEKMGWMRVVRWFGCVGMAVSSLSFYYIPQYFGNNFYIALIPAVSLGIFVAAFVPMTAVFPALEPNHKGAAISTYNLSAGLSNFLAPAIAVILLPRFDTIGVVIAYTLLYIFAFFISYLINVEQPGFERKESELVKYIPGQT